MDCNEVIDKALLVLERLLQESDAQVDVAPLPVVLGDDSQLLQLFQNLISNSIKYAGEHPPEITISAEYVEEMGKWLFSVRDKGIGIDPADLEYIFILFKRARNVPDYVEGSGVGLSICKRIVERHGGKIWVESVLGEGAAFYFTLFCGEEAEEQA